jgi:hypothetical protein
MTPKVAAAAATATGEATSYFKARP